MQLAGDALSFSGAGICAGEVAFGGQSERELFSHPVHAVLQAGQLVVAAHRDPALQVTVGERLRRVGEPAHRPMHCGVPEEESDGKGDAEYDDARD